MKRRVPVRALLFGSVIALATLLGGSSRVHAAVVDEAAVLGAWRDRCAAVVETCEALGPRRFRVAAGGVEGELVIDAISIDRRSLDLGESYIIASVDTRWAVPPPPGSLARRIERLDLLYYDTEAAAWYDGPAWERRGKDEVPLAVGTTDPARLGPWILGSLGAALLGWVVFEARARRRRATAASGRAVELLAEAVALLQEIRDSLHQVETPTRAGSVKTLEVERVEETRRERTSSTS